MLETIRELIHLNDLCVLATTGEKGPHTSLMAYACSPDCGEIYLVTSRNTQKFQNMLHASSISIMIDSRTHNERSGIRALTVTGTASQIEDPEMLACVRDRMLARHPHLSELIHQPDVAWICVHVSHFQLLDGVHRSYHVAPEDQGYS